MANLVVSGDGRMGSMLIQGLEKESDFDVVGVISPLAEESAGKMHTPRGSEIPWSRDPADLINMVRPDVVIDFTNAEFTPSLVDACMEYGVRPVIGTSGVDEITIERLSAYCTANNLGSVYAANFAVGAVILSHLAKIASRFFERAEVIELHHEGKVDAPSGTAIALAEAMHAGRGSDFIFNKPELTHVDGTRDGNLGGVGIHSVRLPGFVASHEVIFGDASQTLTLRHDSIGRDSFLPGVSLAIREALRLNHLVVGLESLIGLEEN